MIWFPVRKAVPELERVLVYPDTYIVPLLVVTVLDFPVIYTRPPSATVVIEAVLPDTLTMPLLVVMFVVLPVINMSPLEALVVIVGLFPVMYIFPALLLIV